MPWSSGSGRKLTPVNTSLEAPDKANAYFYAVTPVNMDQQDPDYPAMVLADRIIGGDEKSRLWVRIREKEGLSYGVNSTFRAGPQEKYGSFAAVASAKPEKAAKVEAAFKDEIAKVVSSGFSAEEVASAKNALMQERQLGRSQDEPAGGTVREPGRARPDHAAGERSGKEDQRYDSRTAFGDLQEVDRPGVDFLLQGGGFQEGRRGDCEVNQAANKRELTQMERTSEPSRLFHFSVADVDDAMRVHGDIVLMRHQHDGIALLVQLREQRHDVVAGGGIERAGGLVGQQKRRMVHQRPGDGHALALPAR